MSLTLHRSEEFNVDFDVQYRWYLREAGETVAERYMSAVLATVHALSQAPGSALSGDFDIKRCEICVLFGSAVHLTGMFCSTVTQNQICSSNG